jgi:hypothetical protein
MKHPWILRMQSPANFNEELARDATLNLYSFKRVSVFQSAVVSIIAHFKQTPEQIIELGQYFKALDINYDGFLSL